MQQTYIIYKVLRDEFYSTYIEHTYRGIVHLEQKFIQFIQSKSLSKSGKQSRAEAINQTMQQTYIIYKVLRDGFYSTYIEHTYREIVHLEQKFIQSIQSRS